MKPDGQILSTPCKARRDFLELSGKTVAAGISAALPMNVLAQGATGKLGIAVVGLGQFAQYVLPRLAQCQKSQLVALVSGSPEKARSLASRYGVATRNLYDYASFDQIRNNPDIDFVYIALPVGLHAEYAIRALLAGKHVLVEKTMAADVAQARKMVEAAQRTKRQLMVAYRSRFDPYNQAMIRMSRDRELGTVTSIMADKGFKINLPPDNWRFKRELAGGGSLVDIGIYSVQAMRYLTGEEPVEVSAIRHSSAGNPRFREVEESIHWQMRFAGGTLANGSASWNYTNQNRYRVVATDGWFELEPATSNMNLRMRIGRGQSIEERALAQVDQIPAMFDHFADCIRQNVTPLIPIDDGLRDLEAIAAIYEAADTGKRVRVRNT